MLSLKEIRELIDLVAERGLSGLEIERAGFRLRIEGRRPAAAEPQTPRTVEEKIAGAAAPKAAKRTGKRAGSA